MATLRMAAEYDQFEPTSFDPLPEGNYVCIVSESKVGAPKSNAKAEMITLTAEVVDGPHKGRKLWFRFNTVHPNATAQNIGRSQWAAFRKACGVPAPRDTIELHNIPFVAHLKLRKDDNGELQNEPKYPCFSPAGRGPAPAQHAAAKSEAPPWAPQARGGDGASATGGVPGVDVPF